MKKQNTATTKPRLMEKKKTSNKETLSTDWETFDRSVSYEEIAHLKSQVRAPNSPHWFLWRVDTLSLQ